MTHFPRHPEAAARSAARRKSGLPDLRTYNPISGKSEIDGRRPRKLPRVTGRSSFEALALCALAPQDDGPCLASLVLLLHDHFGADRHACVEIGDLLVDQPEAPR